MLLHADIHTYRPSSVMVSCYLWHYCNRQCVSVYTPSS